MMVKSNNVTRFEDSREYKEFLLREKSMEGIGDPILFVTIL